MKCFGRMTGNPECAGLNRHVVGIQEPYRKGSSESILTSSLAGDTARCFLKRRRKHRWGLEGIGQLPRFLTENALGKDLLFSKAFIGRECPNCAMHKATACYA
jgi:hypothetical protein